MRSVAVVATGKTAFGSFPELSIRELAREAGAKCLEGSKADPDQVEALYVGNFAGPSFVGQNHLAPYRKKTSARFQPSEQPVTKLSRLQAFGQRTLMSPRSTTVLRSPRSLRSRI